jgi:hypothetical protein
MERRERLNVTSGGVIQFIINSPIDNRPPFFFQQGTARR